MWVGTSDPGVRRYAKVESVRLLGSHVGYLPIGAITVCGQVAVPEQNGELTAVFSWKFNAFLF